MLPPLVLHAEGYKDSSPERTLSGPYNADNSGQASALVDTQSVNSQCADMRLCTCSHPRILLDTRAQQRKCSEQYAEISQQPGNTQQEVPSAVQL
jgi:hypothetical protein